MNREWGVFEERTAGRGWVASATAILLFGAFGWAVAADLPAPASGPAAGHWVTLLKYHEVDYVPLYREITLESEAPFRKEPAFSQGSVFRGLWKLGTNAANHVPFVWDVERGKLYLDLNRNRDLTDDPDGVFSSANKSLQLFTGIRLTFRAGSAKYRSRLDAHIFGSAGEKPRVFLYARSVWDGFLELGGRRWQVAVVDNFDGRIGPATGLAEIGDRLLLRGAEEPAQPRLWWHASLPMIHDLDHAKLITALYRHAGNSEVIDAFNLPANLFFQDRAYRLTCRLDEHEERTDLELSLDAVEPPRGKVRLGGEHIRRLVLDHGFSPEGFCVVLDSPGAEVEVPAGEYPRQTALLQRSGFTNAAVGVATNRLRMETGGAASLLAGAPLFNAVEFQPAIGMRLNYRLTNGAGWDFRLAAQSETNAPRFEVRQGDRLVADGKFAFG